MGRRKADEKKCAKCKEIIPIDFNDIKDIVYFRKQYYHVSCFQETCERMAKSKRALPVWQEAIDDNFKQAERDAEKEIRYYYDRDRLYNHLLASYDVAKVNKYAMSNLGDIELGKYKGTSKPIPYKEFADCWIETQSYLDRNYAKAQQQGKSMTGDQRINYDMAVVISLFPKWKNKKAAEASAKVEMERTAKVDEIDMSRIAKQNRETKRDMSDISDDIFVL